MYILTIYVYFHNLRRGGWTIGRCLLNTFTINSSSLICWKYIDTYIGFIDKAGNKTWAVMFSSKPWSLFCDLDTIMSIISSNILPKWPHNFNVTCQQNLVSEVYPPNINSYNKTTNTMGGGGRSGSVMARGSIPSGNGVKPSFTSFAFDSKWGCCLLMTSLSMGRKIQPTNRYNGHNCTIL